MVVRKMPNEDDGMAIKRKVDFLRRTESYRETTSSVGTIETHKSWIFLTDQFAYKLKKAIRYDSVDFRALETRHRNCLEEVRLNQRLAAGAYLGVVPLTAEESGNLTLGGDGVPVDWLVKMRRLPDDLMLDRKIREGTLDEREVRRVAAKLAIYYQSAPRAQVDGNRYRDMLREEIRINERDLLSHSSGENSLRVVAVIEAQLEFLAHNPRAFDQRVDDGHIVEGHGDLRPEHVCLETVPVIFDCLEFNSKLRTIDAADELAFLALQCERLGATWVGEILFATYAAVTGDVPSEKLVKFYKSYRSATWARLAVWRAREIDGVAREKWAARTQEYLNLASRFSVALT